MRKRRSIMCVNVRDQSKCRAISSLHHAKQHSTVSLTNHLRHRIKVFCLSNCHTIREFSQTRAMRRVQFSPQHRYQKNHLAENKFDFSSHILPRNAYYCKVESRRSDGLITPIPPRSLRPTCLQQQNIHHFVQLNASHIFIFHLDLLVSS